MRFLITNDDGVDAPGIAALARAASQLGEVVVVAPQDAHSGCGHRVTSDGAISVREREAGWWVVGGTPADCTRIGVQELVSDCDWVLAGVNAGANLGVDVFMSGTVAAVREAALLGKPGLAFSCYRSAGGSFDWAFAERTAHRILGRVLDDTTPEGHFWNANLPDLRGHDRTPELIDCPIGKRHLPMHFESEAGRYHYRGVYHDRPRDEGDDIDVCFSGDVAVTRMSVW